MKVELEFKLNARAEFRVACGRSDNLSGRLPFAAIAAVRVQFEEQRIQAMSFLRKVEDEGSKRTSDDQWRQSSVGENKCNRKHIACSQEPLSLPQNPKTQLACLRATAQLGRWRRRLLEHERAGEPKARPRTKRQTSPI